MRSGEIPVALRDHLSPEGSEGLLEVLDRAHQEAVRAAMTVCSERFERRLTETSSALRLEMHQGFAALRQEMHGGLSALRQEMSSECAAVRRELYEGLAAVRQEMGVLRADLLKWAFVFWVGQLAGVAAMLGLVLHALS